jgi:hypothetical protein
VIIEQARFVRVNADRGVNKRVLFGHAERRAVRVGGDFPIADADDYLYTGLLCALDNEVAVLVKVLHLNVRVRIYIHCAVPEEQ